MNVFRIHIRPTGGLKDSKLPFDYCLKEGVLGLGWQTESQTNSASWESYEAEASEQYGTKGISRVRYLKNNVKQNDLIWTRDTEGHYFLGKVNSEWEYFTNPEAQAADIVNIVRCTLKNVQSVDDVPGKVVACFRPSRTIQAIRDETATDYSKYLWNKLIERDDFRISKERYADVFSFLGSEDTEDVIFVYLQMQGWVVIPHSRKSDTMRYEYYLINKDSKERAIVQVKTGRTPLTVSDWDKYNEKVFLFQSNVNYNGMSQGNVVCIAPRDIKSFMFGNRELLPSSICHWLDVASSEKTHSSNHHNLIT
jgi:hypothetical protein